MMMSMSCCCVADNCLAESPSLRIRGRMRLLAEAEDNGGVRTYIATLIAIVELMMVYLIFQSPID